MSTNSRIDSRIDERAEARRDRELNILVASGGRRPYLVRWFREALRLNGVEGRVILADIDVYSPARTVADDFARAVPIAAPEYPEWLEQTLVEQRISLAISINDFEVSQWADMREQHPARFAALICLDRDRQRAVEDKLRTALLLDRVGIRSPVTMLASTALRMAPADLESTLGADVLVVKGRYGSCSRGLEFATAAALEDAVAQARRDVTDSRGGRPADPADLDDLIVVQPRIRGEEFGADVVADFGGRFASVLTRRILHMRAGESDTAVTGAEDQFEDLARRIAAVMRHRGLIGLDAIVDDDGKQWVLDINPRFGGGYPFSHAAGAHIPAAYVAWALGEQPSNGWLHSRPFVAGGKFYEVLPVSVGPPDLRHESRILEKRRR